MTASSRIVAVGALLLITAWLPAEASPGDVYVPAHRTRDGSYVPPNVAPLSGGTYLARRPTRHGARVSRLPKRGVVLAATRK